MEKKFFFLGILYASGSIKSKSKIEFQTKRKEFAEIICGVVKEFAKPIIKSNSFYTIRIIDKELNKKLKVAINKEKLPIGILNSEEKIKSFLRGFFEAKSSISISKRLIKVSGKKEVLEQIKSLLNKVGVSSNIYKTGGYYSLYIEGKTKCKTFRENIGFASKEKKELLEKLISYH